jgi:hypothetical protein
MFLPNITTPPLSHGDGGGDGDVAVVVGFDATVAADGSDVVVVDAACAATSVDGDVTSSVVVFVVVVGSDVVVVDVACAATSVDSDVASAVVIVVVVVVGSDVDVVDAACDPTYVDGVVASSAVVVVIAAASNVNDASDLDATIYASYSCH